MKQLKITIDNKEIDIYNQESMRLALTYCVADISNITSHNASFSKTVTFPGTKKNDLIFGHGADINSMTALSQNLKPSFKIELEGTLIMEGYCKFSIVKTNDNKHD